MLVAVLGTVFSANGSDNWSLIANTLLSKAWASAEWFAYSMPYFALRYPVDKKHFYQQLRAKQRRQSSQLSDGHTQPSAIIKTPQSV
jgi:hypothetical protein